MRDAEFDGLIVTGFKMQPWDEHLCAPVAAVQCPGINEILGGCNRLIITQRHNQQQIFRHALAEPQEEFQIEIGV